MTNHDRVEQSLAGLQGQVDRHQQCVRTILAGSTTLTDGKSCICADCAHRRRFCSVLPDAIRVLEDTREAFKSKQLEGRRKEFVRIL